MKTDRVLGLATAILLAGCVTEKPAVSDSTTTTTEVTSSTVTILPESTVESRAVSSTSSVQVSAVPPRPSATVPGPVPAATPAVTAAPARPATPSAATAPVVAQPAPKPTVQPVTPAPTVAVAPSAVGQDSTGKIAYEDNCRKCHGVRGVAPKTMKAKYPKIVTFDAEFFAKRTDDSVVKVLTNGKNENMKSFKDKLTHAQMVAVAGYIRMFAKQP